ncbi:ABC transporter permease [Pseudochelatococcus sp. B33]
MKLSNVVQLGIKELRGLTRDPVLLVLIVYAFSLSVYSAATAIPETLNKAPIAIVDEDRSPLADRIIGAFYPPLFIPPEIITRDEMDRRMDAGLDTFALNIPPGFQRDLLAGRQPVIQLNVDATRMSQAFSGSGYVQTIVTAEINEFLARYRANAVLPVDLALRARFNPELNKRWFGAVVQIINNVTMLAVILTGTALIREREHGTVEHLLVMPVTPLEIMLSKVWSMGFVVLVATAFSLIVLVQGIMQVPLQGSLLLFFLGVALHLFATTSLGIFLATLSGSMPQFGLLLMMALMPLNILSGGSTPRESMPEFVQVIMLAAPTTHFVSLAQGILFRGAGFAIVWPQFAALAAIGAVLFVFSLRRFRRSLK